MRLDDFNLMSQLVDSMNLAVDEMEKALKKQNADQFRKSKEEILRFHKKIAEIAG